MLGKEGCDPPRAKTPRAGADGGGGGGTSWKRIFYLLGDVGERKKKNVENSIGSRRGLPEKENESTRKETEGDSTPSIPQKGMDSIKWAESVSSGGGKVEVARRSGEHPRRERGREGAVV